MAISTGVSLVDLLAVLTTLVAVVYAYFKWSLQYWKRRNIPQLEATIPYGTFQNPFSRTSSWLEELSDIYNRTKSNGWRYSGTYMLVAPIFFVVDLELAKNVLTKDFQYFTDRGLYVNEQEPITCHLINLGGQQWRNLRTKVTPAFSSAKLKAMFQTVVDCGLALENYFEGTGNREAVDIKDVLECFTTDVIGSCAFGFECNSLKDPNCDFRVFCKKVFRKSRLQHFKETFSHNYPATARTLGFRYYPKDTVDFFRKIVEDAVNYREKNNVERKDCLQLLIDIKNNKNVDEKYKGDGTSLTMTEIASQSAMFFNAGYETSATTMMFALYEMAAHSEIQQKLRKEIKTVLDKHHGQITYDSVSEMKYLGQVMDEVLRLHPAAPFTVRRCVEDYKIPGADAIIEKGTRVYIPICAIQRDGEYYENPDIFDPDRFSDENKQGRHQFAYMPFGEGPRICIGQRFGLMQGKVGLVSILRKFNVTLNERTRLPLKLSPKTFVMTPQDTILLNVERADLS